jgi:hypothetical protein
MEARKQFLTPGALARLWGVSPDHVLGLIHAGELMATNIAVNPMGRPRWVIDPADVEIFERRRRSVGGAGSDGRPRRRRGPAEREFFTPDGRFTGVMG